MAEYDDNQIYDISGRTLNYLMGAARQVYAAGQNFQPRNVSTADDRGKIKIRNDVGADLTKFGIVTVGDSLFTDGVDYDSRNWFEGLEPTESGQIAVVQEPVGEDETRVIPAVVAGVTRCKVDIVSESHGYAKAIAGDSGKLQSADSGSVRIMSKPSGTGDKDCIVFLGAPSIGSGGLWVFAAGDYSYGTDVGPFSLLREDGGGTLDGIYWDALGEAGDVILEDDLVYVTPFSVGVSASPSGWRITVWPCHAAAQASAFGTVAELNAGLDPAGQELGSTATVTGPLNRGVYMLVDNVGGATVGKSPTAEWELQ